MSRKSNRDSTESISSYKSEVLTTIVTQSTPESYKAMPKVEDEIMKNIDYGCKDFKHLVSVSLQRIHMDKSKPLQLADEEKWRIAKER